LPNRDDLAAVRRSPRSDLLAGVTVAVVALPLALGFGIASGVGARAGLVTAIIAGAIAAIFGGSNVQVTGPTGAMTVVLLPIVTKHGIDGVLTAGLMAGLILTVLAVARAGRVMTFVPAPVVEGFTIGIASVITLQQLPLAFGTSDVHGDKPLSIAVDTVRAFLQQPHLAPTVIAIGVAAVILIGARVRPTVPVSLLALAIVTVVTNLMDLQVERIGTLSGGLPMPSLGFVHWNGLSDLVAPAVAIAALAALESLMSATAADAMTVSEAHDSDRELFGQGIANIAAPMFGGVAATGAIARTAVNVRSRASSRLAALTHSIVLAAIALGAAPLVADIPLSGLAGVLIATAIRMVEVGSVRALARSGRGELVLMAVTAAATLTFNLVVAVVAGLIVAGIRALRSVANSARLEVVPLHSDLAHVDHHLEEQALLHAHIAAYRIDGPLFFAAAHRFLLELTEVADVRVVILRMSRITAVDATGAYVLKDAIDRLTRRGATVLVSGLLADHDRRLDALGILDDLKASGRVFATTPDAIRYARGLLHTDGLLTPS
jgi:SulP family sulfate permease